MRTDRRTRGVAAVTLASFIVGVGAPALAQQAPPEQPMYQPPPQPGQPYYPAQPAPQGQPYPGQPAPQGQPYYPQPGQPYDPNQPPPAYPPPTYAAPMPPQRVPIRYELRPRYGLIAGGASMLGAMYLITAIAGLATVAASDIAREVGCDGGAGCPTAAWPLFVPVAGPFIQMGYLSGAGANTARVLLAFDGMVQLGGLAMIIAGSLARKKVPVYAQRFQLLPMASAGGGGLLAQARF